MHLIAEVLKIRQERVTSSKRLASQTEIRQVSDDDMMKPIKPIFR